MGLQLHLGKCELILPSGALAPECESRFPRPLVVDAEGRDRVLRDGNFEFLGTPIGADVFCEAETTRRAEKASRLLNGLAELEDPQVGLRLVR